MSRKTMEDTVIKLVNSQEIKEWVFLFEQKIQKEKIRNSKYMSLYKNKSPHYQFIEEHEKLSEIQAAEKKIEKKSSKRVMILRKYQSATEKNNEKLMKKIENQILEINEKIDCLRVFIDDKKEEVKLLEKQRCKLLTESQENAVELSQEDRAIRSIENEIWKIILNDYFQNKDEKILVLAEYEQYVENFKKVLKANINQSNANNSKYNDALLDIIKTLYGDVSRDKIFLKNEKIKTDKWEDINLNEDSKTSELEDKFPSHRCRLFFN